MRVLELVTWSDWGGAQAQVLLTTRELLARGHDVHVAAGGSGVLLRRAQDAGAAVHRLRHLTVPVSPGRDLLALCELITLLNTTSPDLLHTHSAKAGVLGRTAAAAVAAIASIAAAVAATPATALTAANGAGCGRRLRAPAVVHTSHGLSWGPGRRQGVAASVFKAAERLTGRWCDCVICVSEELRRSIVAQRLYPRARTEVIYNGIDVGAPGPGPFAPESRDARRSLGLPPDGPLLVLVGRLVPGKGHALAVEAAVELARGSSVAGGAGVSIAFAGDGPLRFQLEIAARAARSAGAGVVLLGHRDDVPAILRCADILIAPSLAEGLPLAAIEGMAAGLPVVASRIPGLREVVLDRKTGLLFDLAGGAARLAEAVRALLDEPGLARRLGAAGRARAEALFSLRNTSRLADFLDDIARRTTSGHLRAAEATDG